MNTTALEQIHHLNMMMIRVKGAWNVDEITQALTILEESDEEPVILAVLAPVFYEWGQVLSEVAFQFYDAAGTCREEAGHPEA